jgi:hypothetical protein
MVKSASVSGEALDWMLDMDNEIDREARSGQLASDLMAYTGDNKVTKTNRMCKEKKRNVSTRNKTRKS